jgi:hypothetical protein
MLLQPVSLVNGESERRLRPGQTMMQSLLMEDIR